MSEREIGRKERIWVWGKEKEEKMKNMERNGKKREKLEEKKKQVSKDCRGMRERGVEERGKKTEKEKK